MVMRFWLKGESKGFDLLKIKDLDRLNDSFNNCSKADSNSPKEGWYMCRLEGEQTFQNKFIRCDEIVAISSATMGG
jgi:hypothetical protein